MPGSAMKSQFAAFDMSIGGRLPFPLLFPFPLEWGVADATPAIAKIRTAAATAALNQVLIRFPPSWPLPAIPPIGWSKPAAGRR